MCAKNIQLILPINLDLNINGNFYNHILVMASFPFFPFYSIHAFFTSFITCN